MILDAHPQFTEAVAEFAAGRRPPRGRALRQPRRPAGLGRCRRSGMLRERLGVELFALSCDLVVDDRTRAPAGAGGAREPVRPLQHLRGPVVAGGHPLRPPRGPRPPARARVPPDAGFAARRGPVARRGRRRLHRLPPLLPQDRREAVAGGHPLRGHPAPPAALLPPRRPAAPAPPRPALAARIRAAGGLHGHRGRGGGGGHAAPGQPGPPRDGGQRPLRPGQPQRPAPGRGGPAGDPGLRRAWSPGTPTNPSCRWWATGSTPTPGAAPPRWWAASHGSGCPIPSSPCTASPTSRSWRRRCSSVKLWLREVPVRSPVLLERLALARSKVDTSTTTLVGALPDGPTWPLDDSGSSGGWSGAGRQGGGRGSC